MGLGVKSGVRSWRCAVMRCAALALAVALGGCVEAATEIASAPIPHRPLERREGVSLASATVAVVSIDGAPDSVAASFRQTLASEAKARDIVIVPADKARYLVRGYLSANAATGGATLEYVWDVFGPDKLREQRLNDIITVKGQGDDPWAIAGDKALASVAALVAIGDLGAVGASEAVAELARSSNAPLVVEEAVATLGALGVEAGLELILDLLEGAKPALRRRCGAALGGALAAGASLHSQVVVVEVLLV